MKMKKKTTRKNMTDTKASYEEAKAAYIKACELCDKFTDITTTEEAEAFVKTLSEDEIDLLKEEYWGRKCPKDALTHILMQCIKPTTKKFLCGGILGSTTGVGSYLAGATVLTAAMMGAGGFLLGSTIISIVDEKHATKRAISPILEKAKSWIKT